LVGRERELELVLAAVAAGRDLLLEGPPGTSKSTMLRAITSSWGIPLLLVEGNADLTPAKLIGHHNPARVLREDYSADNFVAGPLTEAMRQGGFLYIEEFNRTPEDTLNALLTAMAEREIAVPRVGRIVAKDSFRLVASMNPYDNIGTTRISASIHDRMCRLAIAYQTEVDERGIVARQTGSVDQRLIADAVAIVRASRSHPVVSLGSSVRGAIDLTLIAVELAVVRFGALDEFEGAGGGVAGSGAAGGSGWSQVLDEQDYSALVLDAATLALSGRLTLHRTTDTTAEDIIDGLVTDRLAST
jgi:MoxR-like ATPase